MIALRVCGSWFAIYLHYYIRVVGDILQTLFKLLHSTLPGGSWVVITGDISGITSLPLVITLFGVNGNPRPWTIIVATQEYSRAPEPQRQP